MRAPAAATDRHGARPVHLAAFEGLGGQNYGEPTRWEEARAV